MLTYYCDNNRHLICSPYSIENLHKMAIELNLNKGWFHGDHYDIPKKRIEEIKSKCIIIRPREILEIINENMQIKKIKIIKEYGGAGISYSGGSSIFPVNRGGSMNRGGFGGASNLGGPNMMYTYEIKPLNRTLQPEVNSVEGDEILHPGNDISGCELNKKDNKLHSGTLLRVEKTLEGSLKYYVILDPETNMIMKLDPTTVNIISKFDGVDPLKKDLTDDEKELLKGGQATKASLYAPGKTNENNNNKMKAKLVKESLDIIFEYNKMRDAEPHQDVINSEKLQMAHASWDNKQKQLEIEDDEAFELAKKEAKQISKDERCVQHVNQIRMGLYKVEDWFDSDKTITSYENGMEL